MKNKLVYILTFLLLFIPINVYANEIILKCPKEIAKQSEFTCKITGKSDIKVTGIAANLSVSDDLSLISVSIDNKWQGDGKNGDIKIFIDPEVSGVFDIGTIKLKSSGENNSILINSIFFYDEKVKAQKVSPISLSIPLNEKLTENKDEYDANSNYLVDLKIANHDINFYKQNNEYDITIGDEETLSITPVLEDDSATYQITGNSKLSNGSKIKIEVLSQDGEKRLYILNIKKGNGSKNMSYIFISLVLILIATNVVRILMNRKNRGKKNE